MHDYNLIDSSNLLLHCMQQTKLDMKDVKSFFGQDCHCDDSYFCEMSDILRMKFVAKIRR